MAMRETKVPQAVTLGVALAVSIGGIAFTVFRSKRIKPSEHDDSLNSPVCGIVDDDPGFVSLQTDDNRLQKEEYECGAKGYYTDGLCFVADTEAKDFNRFKFAELQKQEQEFVKTLQDENTKLKSEIGDYAKMVVELQGEIAKLKKKHRFNTQQNMDKIFNLQDWKLDVQVKELEEMKKANENLRMENSDLSLKLDKLQLLAASALDNGKQVEELERQTQRLRQEIEKLEKEKDSDLEELVYLRWVNACYRHQLMHEESPGRTPTREMFTATSPKSQHNSKDSELGSKTNTSPKAKVLSKVIKVWKGKVNKPVAEEEEKHTLTTSPRLSSNVNGSDSLDGGLIIYRKLNSITPTTEKSPPRGILYQKDEVHDELIKYSEALKISNGR